MRQPPSLKGGQGLLSHSCLAKGRRATGQRVKATQTAKRGRGAAMVKKASPAHSQQLFIGTVAGSHERCTNKIRGPQKQTCHTCTLVPSWENMVSEKKAEEKKKQKQRRATSWRGPGKAGMNHRLARSVFPWHDHKEEQWIIASRRW